MEPTVQVGAANIHYFMPPRKLKVLMQQEQTTFVLVPEDGTKLNGYKERHVRTNWSCNECGRKSTPQMRAGPDGKHTLCNRCGIRWANKNKSSIRQHVVDQHIEEVAAILSNMDSLYKWQDT